MERLTTRARGLALMVDTGPCAVAGIVDRLAAYEDTGLTPEEIMALIPLPNDPLTLEELRGMDGEPVWIVPMRGSGGFCTWMLVDAEYELCREAHGEMAVFENCGKTWLAYRRKPEEG